MSKIKPNYLIIPAFTVLVSRLGRYFSEAGMRWYRGILQKPVFTPPEWVFPLVWSTIYFLTTICALLVYNTFERTTKTKVIMGLFILNGLLCIQWTYLFFYQHMIGAALINSIVTLSTVVALIVLIGSTSKRTALLLVPYLLWLSFAVFLNHRIYMINKPTGVFEYLLN